MNINQEFTKIDNVSQELLNTFLQPYKEDCKYLKKAQFQQPALSENTKNAGNNKPGLWLMKGEFSIPDSCYIDDTGHFNSVEFNICYNQIIYILIAYLIKNKLLEPMNDWTLEEYKHRQLSDFLIVKFSSTFKKPINSNHFQGTLSINKVSVRGDLIMLKTSCAYYDDNGGWSEGDVTIAILNPKHEKTIQRQKESILV
ncbi:MAG: FcoT family thioesterase [Cyanobacteria bacterium P01_H01_bin.150]